MERGQLAEAVAADGDGLDPEPAQPLEPEEGGEADRGLSDLGLRERLPPLRQQRLLRHAVEGTEDEVEERLAGTGRQLRCPREPLDERASHVELLRALAGEQEADARRGGCVPHERVGPCREHLPRCGRRLREQGCHRPQPVRELFGRACDDRGSNGPAWLARELRREVEQLGDARLLGHRHELGDARTQRVGRVGCEHEELRLLARREQGALAQRRLERRRGRIARLERSRGS